MEARDDNAGFVNNDKGDKASEIGDNPYTQSLSGKKPRRGRNDRSTSGDERTAQNQSRSDSQDVRFDERGRPITADGKLINPPSPQKSSPTKISQPPKTPQQKASLDQKGSIRPDPREKPSQSSKASLERNPSPEQAKREKSNSQGRKGTRRGRNERGSSGSDEIMMAQPSQNSPFEPRSISKLPKPTTKEQTPQRSMQKVAADNAIQKTNEDGTFRDY